MSGRATAAPRAVPGTSADVDVTGTGDRPRVLFVCARNAGRSALAVALAAHRGAGRIVADSAGTTPDTGPSASTVATLTELGIDASGHRPKAVTRELVAAADVVVAMKPGLDLPAVPGVRYETWTLPDPAGWDAEGIRPLRQQIDACVQALIADLTGTDPTATTDVGTVPTGTLHPGPGGTP
jgi:arsenate reductase (thioredoxin)